MKSQDFFLIAIEDMRGEAPVCLEHLPRDCVTYSMLLLCQVSNVIAMGVHDDVAICLFKAHENIHHLKLPLYNERRIVKKAHGGVGLFEDRMRVFGHINRSYEVVL